MLRTPGLEAPLAGQRISSKAKAFWATLAPLHDRSHNLLHVSVWRQQGHSMLFHQSQGYANRVCRSKNAESTTPAHVWGECKPPEEKESLPLEHWEPPRWFFHLCGDSRSLQLQGPQRYSSQGAVLQVLWLLGWLLIGCMLAGCTLVVCVPPVARTDLWFGGLGAFGAGIAAEWKAEKKANFRCDAYVHLRSLWLAVQQEGSLLLVVHSLWLAVGQMCGLGLFVLDDSGAAELQAVGCSLCV